MKIHCENNFCSYLNWRAVICSGALVGALFLFASREPSGNFAASFLTAGNSFFTAERANLYVGFLFHMARAFFYALIVSSVVCRVDTVRALALGAAVGLFLYGINAGIVSLAGQDFTSATTGSSLLIHLVFGILTAAAYKSFSAQRTESPTSIESDENAEYEKRNY